jgi:hypothetical protein
MPQSGPRSIFLVGILNIVIGMIGVVWQTCGTATVLGEQQLAARFFDQEQRDNLPASEQELAEKAPYLRAFQLIVWIAVPWLLTLILLASGVGLLRLRTWGWILAIVYALLSLLHKIVVGTYTIFFLLGTPMAPLNALGPRQDEVVAVIETMWSMMSVAMPFLLTIYPIAVLILLNRTAVLAAFRQRPELVEEAA